MTPSISMAHVLVTTLRLVVKSAWSVRDALWDGRRPQIPGRWGSWRLTYPVHAIVGDMSAIFAMYDNDAGRSRKGEDRRSK